MTTTQSSPIVSLQEPKDVSIEEIEAELHQLWQNYSSSEEGLTASRATTFSIVVYEPDATQQLLAALGFYESSVDGIAGSQTTAAIKAAQKGYGLSVTGKPEPELLSKLREEYTQAKQNDSTEESTTAAPQSSPDLESSGVTNAIAASNPCRIITLCPTLGEDEGVEAQVSAYCPIDQQSQNTTLVCCEYITLRGTAAALERIRGMISTLRLNELPKFVWWRATPQPEYALFQRLAANSELVMIDSSTFNNPEVDLLRAGDLIEQGMPLADLNWRRLSAWQELAAEAFDPPERRSALGELDRVTIDYEKGNQAQALMYLGWLASRLQWRPVSYQIEGGDYEIRKIKFSAENQRSIEAELAAIPIADQGEISGDLISLRLSSTNLEADCCTVLCSETTGCMRMEAGGGAQSCRIEQVTPLFDQKTEKLLAQQLQRQTREVLYEESMSVTHEIVQLANS
ncbi:MAG: glucose-6-phosphate dehydrogenase assembly protein OpcA [Cyanobacteria bacterium QH_8_48_120]|jgi:glucose-6-phosphate dehydrogenase assembly protein OpcA|nr:MAG: glucose-6-phosphate dehydrogenase assembly protein OpcA [Cyanobacteria bacterium QH_1_48_107]PSO54605.1 MAG: glucose-6-phosphate dehydrogenase assembly protein OpcA [Cyanobacteria bacterium QH_10_48_56]PSO65990.1 MAG: glucose-6-phosphate dehydrogenase assembly protein OpcA [Cyanobacteria bacterium QH_6_48_35]PSO68774.1 MAG: glucose-6-phosphate dehydrogenase assembly protein OpcA [Cyanobacteria bacterium QS_1_48_34]PSO71227.1 MAG: glucose-6-phosphate dehydrogenase assembly protein OpcA [